MKRLNKICLGILMTTLIIALATLPDGRANPTLQTPWPSRYCVHEVPSGSTIISPDKGEVRYPDGRLVHVDTNTCLDGIWSSTVPTINGWIEDFYNTISSGTFQYLYDEWYVPPAPRVQSNQLIYIFNAFQSTTVYMIVQPVLTWGYYSGLPGQSCGGPFWWIASWFVDITGNAYHSTCIRASPGDYISGQISYSSFDPICGSPAYRITTVDGSNGGTTVYTCADTANSALRKANAGALEAWNLDACSKLPNTSSLTFYSVTETPNVGYWNNQVYSVSPSCNFNAVYPTLYWNPNA